MSHRSDKHFWKTSAGDPRLLVLGVVLVITAVALATCETLEDRLSSSPVVDVGRPSQPGGEQE